MLDHQLPGITILLLSLTAHGGHNFFGKMLDRVLAPIMSVIISAPLRKREPDLFRPRHSPNLTLL